MLSLRKIAAGALLGVLAVTAAGVADDAPGWKVYKKGEALEFKGTKGVGVYAERRFIENGERDLYLSEKGAGTKRLAHRGDVKGLVMTWDKLEPDKFKNKVVKYVAFFIKSGEGWSINTNHDEKGVFAQTYPNQMFAIEIDATKDGHPMEIVDMNEPMGWWVFYVAGCYSNGEWKMAQPRAKDGSWTEQKEGEHYQKNAIMLPEGYEFK